MNDSATIGDIIGPIVCLVLTYGLYKLLYGSPRPRAVRYIPTVSAGGGGNGAAEGPRRGGAPPTLIGEQRYVIAVLDNPHSHPYDNLPLTELHDHLFNEHFEVWNLVVEKATPEKMRREHALDHGMVLR